MKRIFLTCALLFACLPRHAIALTPEQFDKLTCLDRQRYIGTLGIGAAQGLTEHGTKDAIGKINTIFDNDTETGGMAAFYLNLDRVRRLNESNRAKPGDKQTEFTVEHALFLTLKDAGFVVPVNYLLTVNKDFKTSPPIPPQPKTVDLNDKSTARQTIEGTRAYLAWLDWVQTFGIVEDKCELQELRWISEGRLSDLHKTAIRLPENRLGYKNRIGTLVDGNGIPLKGEDLKIAQTFSSANSDVPSFEEVKEAFLNLKSVDKGEEDLKLLLANIPKHRQDALDFIDTLEKVQAH